MRKRKRKPKPTPCPSWIKILVWRTGEWVILNEKTFPVKKGEHVRMRGERKVYEVQKDSKVDRDGGITVHAHLIGMLAE